MNITDQTATPIVRYTINKRHCNAMEKLFFYLFVNFAVFECSAIVLIKDVKIHFISLVCRDKISSYLVDFVQ